MVATALKITAVARAAKIVGGPTKLAKLLGIHRPALYGWHRVPAERVLAIVKATGGKVTDHQLRPDLYPKKREGAAA
jgi:DNA-binding transcriptional regulator YdaS (Cro superfamily)